MREVEALASSSPQLARGSVSVLVADDDRAARSRLVERLRQTGGAVVEARDGAEAVRLGLQLRPSVALVDLDMPPQGGLETALRLRELYTPLRVALQAADPQALTGRVVDPTVPLFAKFDVERVVTWTCTQIAAFDTELRDPLRTVELTCALCGYGISSRVRPDRCPMCHATSPWIRPRRRRTIPAL